MHQVYYNKSNVPSPIKGIIYYRDVYKLKPCCDCR